MEHARADAEQAVSLAEAKHRQEATRANTEIAELLQQLSGSHEENAELSQQVVELAQERLTWQQTVQTHEQENNELMASCLLAQTQAAKHDATLLAIQTEVQRLTGLLTQAEQERDVLTAMTLDHKKYSIFDLFEF